MQLQTKIPLETQGENQIDYNSNVLLIGSCFSENIGDKLGYYKFKNYTNPLGVLFHPKAIETLILNSVEQKSYTEKDIFFYKEQWHCFDAHSKLSHASKQKLLEALNNRLTITRKQIEESTHIIITLGTSWLYRDLKTNCFVANCHKLPQKQFEKELLPVSEIKKALTHILSLIKIINPKTFVIFTVSPIRHIKDGFVNNMQSKAHLITAIHQVLEYQSFYFPSYEIMMDELRDYRFYNQDMIHPSPLAIDYIWERFKSVWVSHESFETMNDVEGIQKGLRHKPFYLESQAHKAFVENLNKKREKLKEQYEHIVF